MKRALLAIIVSALAFPVLASDNETKNQEYLDICKSYAIDDGVAEAELDDFLKMCVKDIQESEKN
jgi:hypothetical protein